MAEVPVKEDIEMAHSGGAGGYSLGTGGYQEYIPPEFLDFEPGNITGTDIASMFNLSTPRQHEASFAPFARSLMDMLQGVGPEMHRLGDEAVTALGGAVETGRSSLSDLFTKVSGMGKGFSGFGGRQRAEDVGRGGIQSAFGEQYSNIQSTLLSKIRGDVQDPFSVLYNRMAGVYGDLLSEGATIFTPSIEQDVDPYEKGECEAGMEMCPDGETCVMIGTINWNCE